MTLLWIVLFLFTAGRLFIAASGSLSGLEAYLMLCAQRLDWGFVEGPAGVPALIRIATSLAGCSSFGVRLLAPFLLLLSSFIVAQLACRLRDKETAFWSVLVFNLLPLSNVAALVMDGTMVVATFWIAALAWSWSLVRNEKNHFFSWFGFGLLLAIATQVSYAIGWLLPLVIAIIIVRRRELLKACDKIFLLGSGAAFLLLALSWIGPILWNVHHDWLQWSQMTWDSFWSWKIDLFSNAVANSPLPSAPDSVRFPADATNFGKSISLFFAPFQATLWFWLMLLALPFCVLGLIHFIFTAEKKEQEDVLSFLVLLLVPFLFCVGSIGHDYPAFGLQLALAAMLLPGVVSFFLKTAWKKKIGLFILLLTGIFSLLIISEIIPVSENSSWSIPSPRGVDGISAATAELVRLRALKKEEPAASSNSAQLLVDQPPFIIAESPDLAALLGAALPIHYPELPDAPSVFTPESPSFSSQFQLWPHYADAVATGIVDPLYTEEPKTSPFFGHDALYVTTESVDELPETISGAFATVVPVSEVTLHYGKRAERLIIYECTNYQMMPL